MNDLFGTIESVELKAIPVTPAKKRGWLPVLTILFLFSYCLMTMLIVEQGQTIESQRALIRELFRDSSELSATKMKAVEERRAQNLAQNPSSQKRAETPSTQAPSHQAPMTQTPSTQVESQRRALNQGKPKFQMPSKPASDVSDNRRALITI